MRQFAFLEKAFTDRNTSLLLHATDNSSKFSWNWLWGRAF